MKKVERFMRDERGLETVEYAVLTSLIVVSLIAAVTALGTAMRSRFNGTTNTINGN